MKDTEIHNNLPEKEIRNLISNGIMKFQKTGERPKRVYSDKWYDNEIENTKSEIIFQQNELQRLENLKAIIQIMKMKGWEEHDVSDFGVSKTDWIWMSFIGTDNEYKKFERKMINIPSVFYFSI